MRIMAVLATAGLGMAGCVAESSVQRIELRSGDFGVAELATVIAVDPIILQLNIVRFDITFGEFAVSLLRENSDTASDIWSETVRVFGGAVAAELEDYIRGLSCVYTLSPQGSFISGAVADAVRFSGEDDDIGTIIAGSGVPFDDPAPAATDRTSDKGIAVIAKGREGKQDDLDISVVSNCLLDVHPGDAVRIVQTPTRMMILPQPLQ